MYVSGVSFALIDLQSIRWLETEEDPSDTAFTIWVNENVIEKMAEAMQATKNALKFYSDYFNAPLYAKTLDIIAVPKFHNGDTEKFGLISLEESTLAFPVNDGRQKYFDLTRELCFAMSRQWIGTSVTMSNLGERYFHHALSYFLEKLCMNEVNPHSDFNFYDLRDVITFSRVLMADYDTKLYSEFESAFNYKLPEGNTKKAFRLFKMLDFILSEKTFQQSLQIYLKMYEHSFSTLDDLWKMFTIKARDNGDLEESMSVEEIMHNWVNENRFPLVRVNIDYVSKIMTLSQEPFKFLGDEQNDAEKVYWNIPLSFKFQSDLDNHSPFLNTMPRFFNEGVETFGLRLDHKDWIIVNPQLNALSHTYYDNDSWGNIQDVLLNPKTFSQIDELTRAHLTLDLFALAEAAVVPYERVFHTMKYLKHEISELCWTIALIEFDKIYSYLLAASSELTKKFENYMKGILGPVFNSVSDDEKNGKSSQQDNLNEESFDEPPNTEPQNTKAALDNTDLNAESEKLSDDSSERDEKFDQLFDVPVRIDEIKRNNRLKMEFLKLFVRSSCKFMVAECGDQSIALFKEWKKGYEDEDAIQRRIPIEIRETVLCYAIQNLSQRDWLFVWDQYVNAKEEKETDIILKALGCSNVKGVLDL
ncbi:hypothetical protein V9T40_011360 [Parthenolecanium corni]|uniref:Uncharacterized protein n=1 Tax=Parthenolecanium corni TaxID=536013 RepID=A0AAN9XYI6_9HEMI